GRLAGGQEGAGADRRKLARVDHDERADVVEVAGRNRHADPRIGARNPRAIVDRRTGRGSGRAVDVGSAEVDVDLLDQLRVELLVGIDRVVAGVVQRDTVESQADTV